MPRKRGIQDVRLTISGISEAFLNDAVCVDQARHVPVGVLQAVEAFVESAVAGGVAVSQEDVVNVA